MHSLTGGGSRSPRFTAAASASSWVWFVSSMRSSRFVCTTRTRPNAAALSVIANASVATIVSRTRTVWGNQRRFGRDLSSSDIGEELVARAAHRLDRLDPERRVDLLAEVADVDLDHVRVAGEVDAPHVVEDLRLRRHVAVLAHEVLEQRELAGGEAHVGLLAPAATGAGVELERPHTEDGRSRGSAPADERP